MKLAGVGLWVGLLWLLAVRALGGESANAVATVTAGFVTSITVTSGGSGYTSEPAVTITGGGGSGATAKAILSGDKVAVVVVLTAGNGYTSIPNVTLAAPAVESWATLRMAPAVRVEGRVGQALVVERLLEPTTTWTPWTNVTAGAMPIEVVDLSQGGDQAKYRSRFTSVPAIATAKLTASFVTAITVTAGGEGYIQPPKVTLSGGGGSGATAQAILDGDRVGTVVVLTAGSGYSSVPLVKIDAPPSELELMSRLVPVLKLRVPLPGGSRVEVGGVIQGPWTTVTNSWSPAGGMEMVDLSPDAPARFYRVQTNTLPSEPAGFVWIPAGTFMMGSPLSEPDRLSDEVQHTVTLTQGFWMSDHEVTQEEYQAVIGSNPSTFIGDLNRPVEQVSWDDAVLYCQKLTDRERAAGRITAQQAYRLPTEAQWEYAARAGTAEARYGELDSIAWWSGNSGDQTHPVKQKAANAWGLYDMLGNVSEMCSDWYALYPNDSVTDPTGPSSGLFGRVSRGNSWLHDARTTRSARRAWRGVGIRAAAMGFRPTLSSDLAVLAPTITVPPQSVTVMVGQKAQLTVTATSKAPLTYQWQFNGMNLAGATQATLVVTNAQLSSAGDYRVVVSNAGGAVTSAVAKLTVNPSGSPSGPAGFVWIAPGTFMMGSPASEPDRQSDEVQHTVTLKQGFWLSDHEVTQGEYQSVMTANPSKFTGDLNRPVEQVSWVDAVSYCQKLTDRERAAGRITAQQAYRLPTEAEWEYAARAGSTEARYGELEVIAWWSGNSSSQTHPVKQKAANAWGLHDMIGNVWEWCSDWEAPYSTTDQADPTGPTNGTDKVNRGGSYLNNRWDNRFSARASNSINDNNEPIGIRVVLAATNSGSGSIVSPYLVKQPEDLVLSVGQTANFLVTVNGTAPIGYQWQFNGMNLAGATQATLVITNAQLSSAGDYRVVVSNSAGSVTSAVAKLTVNPSAPPGGPSGFVWIPPGTFVMGSPLSEPGRGGVEVQYTVTLTQGFWLSDHEVTQEEYQAVMEKNPSFYRGDMSRPVEQVSWNDAVQYCQKLTVRERAAARITIQQAYRLPTEAEWEYAARAGTAGARNGALDIIAWWSGNSGNQTHPVKQKAPNAWGLYDMLGNVYEMVSDWWDLYPTGSVTDPKGPNSGSFRVYRGSSIFDDANSTRLAARYWSPPTGVSDAIGFRPALSSVR